MSDTLTPNTTKRGWYESHPCFGDLLREKLVPTEMEHIVDFIYDELGDSFASICRCTSCSNLIRGMMHDALEAGGGSCSSPDCEFCWEGMNEDEKEYAMEEARYGEQERQQYHDWLYQL